MMQSMDALSMMAAGIPSPQMLMQMQGMPQMMPAMGMMGPGGAQGAPNMPNMMAGLQAARLPMGGASAAPAEDKKSVEAA